MSEATISGTAALPGKTLRELRARAHSLKPVVWIAGNGTTPALLREIDRSLRSHELIKIHAAIDARSERTSLMEAICVATGASAVQIIGKMLVVYRPNPDEPSPSPAVRQSAPQRRAARPRAARASAPNSARTATVRKRP